jgi:GTP-binding protein
MFRDELTLELQAGRGGDGLVSFRREAKVPKGGPDGGDGGAGGDIVFVARGEHNSLLKLGRARRYAAKNGRPGGTGNCTGKSAPDLELDVPVGTQVYDAEHGNLLFDLAEPGARLVIAAGGAGGYGNKRFANSVNQAPRRATPGRPGERRRVRLELKLMAEVGLVGLPNAGKSTFLARVTRATPKIADYPFTTLQPEVGIAAVGDTDTLVIADLPGLIEGAARGHGLGDRFLRHVERCAVLLQFVDVSELAAAEPLTAFQTIDRELERSSPALARKPRLVVGSKCETADDRARLEELAAALRGASAPGRAPLAILPLSSLTGRGVDPLLWAALREVRAAGAARE